MNETGLYYGRSYRLKSGSQFLSQWLWVAPPTRFAGFDGTGITVRFWPWDNKDTNREILFGDDLIVQTWIKDLVTDARYTMSTGTLFPTIYWSGEQLFWYKEFKFQLRDAGNGRFSFEYRGLDETFKVADSLVNKGFLETTSKTNATRNAVVFSAFSMPEPGTSLQPVDSRPNDGYSRVPEELDAMASIHPVNNREVDTEGLPGVQLPPAGTEFGSA